MKSCKLFEFKLTICESGAARSYWSILKMSFSGEITWDYIQLLFFSLIGPLISTNAPLWAIKNSVWVCKCVSVCMCTILQYQLHVSPCLCHCVCNSNGRKFCSKLNRGKLCPVDGRNIHSEMLLDFFGMWEICLSVWNYSISRQEVQNAVLGWTHFVLHNQQ